MSVATLVVGVALFALPADGLAQGIPFGDKGLRLVPKGSSRDRGRDERPVERPRVNDQERRDREARDLAERRDREARQVEDDGRDGEPRRAEGGGRNRDAGRDRPPRSPEERAERRARRQQGL